MLHPTWPKKIHPLKFLQSLLAAQTWIHQRQIQYIETMYNYQNINIHVQIDTF